MKLNTLIQHYDAAWIDKIHSDILLLKLADFV